MLNIKNGSVKLPIKNYRIIDGDTVEVVLEIESPAVRLIENLTVTPKGEVTYIIRFLDIDAPETSDKGGIVSEHFVKSEMDKTNTNFVELFRGVRKKEKFQKDRYKRMLGYIHTERGNLSALLVKHGYANIYTKK